MNAAAGSGGTHPGFVRLRMTARRIENALRRGTFRLRDAVFPSLESRPSRGDLLRLMPAGLSLPVSQADRLAVDLFLRHRFDLLGSGWVSAERGATRPSSPNPANRAAVLRVRQEISPEYAPIDWHSDFKSGHRWSERTGYRDITYPPDAGVDIKVPWELSRLHHLVDMACVHAETRDPVLVAEFRDQTLDWIASNPPRFGVNWACTMDVGIRVANLLFAHDLFRAAGAEFGEAFTDRLADSARAHARHIADNLEWSENVRSNHYLADVCGLFVAAAYLPAGRQSDAWLAFAAQELIAETERQFLPDGGHFEASVCYHGLCAEMISVCATLADALPDSRLPGLFSADASAMRRRPGLRPDTGRRLADHHARSGRLLGDPFYAALARAARFARDVTKPDGTLAQIGDNDGGRFLRSCGWVVAGTAGDCRKRYASLAAFHDLPDDAPCLMMPALDPAPWLAWADAVTGRKGFASDSAPVAAALAGALAKPASRAIDDVSTLSVDVARDAGAPPEAPRDAARHERGDVWVAGGGDLREGGSWTSYPDFGVYVFRSSRVHLVVRCGRALHDGKGVHAHEDQLSFELTVDGLSVTRDPGTFLYEPSHAARNAYRCAGAHVSPSTRRSDGAPDTYAERGAFSPPRHGSGWLISLRDDVFTGRTTVDGGIATRSISISGSGIEIRDEYRLSPPWEPASTGLFAPAKPVNFSPTYGVQVS